MDEKGKPAERERRDWTIILIILLLGFLCVILAGERAIRFSPNWKLDTNMRSNLDPDSDFLTNKPISLYEPLDPSILTQPAWINVFLTPGALIETQIPVQPTNTPFLTITPVPTLFYSPTAVNPTNTQAAILPSPTNTFIYYPPPPPTKTPKPPPTNTPITPLPIADLSITKNDGGTTTVNSGDTVTYTVRVTNSGPSNVTGVILSDPVATGLSKTAVACSPTPGQCVAPPSIAELQGGTFALPVLNNGQFYEIAITTDVTALGGSVTNTANVSVPAGINDPDASNNSALDTNTINVNADLSITITDNSTAYEAGAVKLLPNVPPYAYTITVSNAGPSNVTGATVSNVFSNGNVDPSTIAWVCFPSAGASCTLGPVFGNLNNQPVNLNSGASVTFYLAVEVVSSPSGDLVNEVTVTAPSGVTDAPGNNSATDTDTLITVDPIPPNIEIGTPPNGTPYNLMTPGCLTLNVPITVNGYAGYDLVYYELQNGSGVLLDWIIVQVSDGNNWFTVFYWGDNYPNSNPDTNTNMDFTKLLPPLTSPPPPPEEPDQRDIQAVDLYMSTSGLSTGIAIDLDSIVSSGTYPYLRFCAPSGDVDGQTEIDGIQILP